VRQGIFNILVKLLFGVIILTLMPWSCTKPEPFPDTPRIIFNNLEYVEVAQDGFQDSLILYFDFEDGDGDLGLYSDENSPPFHDRDFVIDNNDKIVTLTADDVQPPLFRITPRFDGDIKEHLSDTDIRPSYNCIDYDTLSIGANRQLTKPDGSPYYFYTDTVIKTDTLFVLKNEFRYNMFVEFDTLGTGGVGPFDWNYYSSPDYGCGLDFNGRFTVLDAENIGTSLQGTIKYSMLSLGFKLAFRTKSFRLRFHIADRQLRKSNIVTTEFMTLQDILRGEQQGD
jgi:hypothetical protein